MQGRGRLSLAVAPLPINTCAYLDKIDGVP